MSETIQKIKDLFISRLKIKISPDQINEETTLFGPDSLGLDSIDVLELVVGIKKEFGIEIVDKDVAKEVFISVGTMARFIEENKSK